MLLLYRIDNFKTVKITLNLFIVRSIEKGAVF